MKLTDEHVRKVKELLNIAIELKNILRQTSPTHILDDKTEVFYNNLVKSLDKTTTFLSEGILFTKTQETNSATLEKETTITLPESSMQFEEFQKLCETVIFIVSSASNKNLLKKVGIPPPNIIEIGGPLTLEDAYLLKPNLPEQAQIGITKRIEAFWQQLSKRIEQVASKQLILILEADKESDKLISKHIDLFKSKYSIPTTVNFFPTLKDINWKQISAIFSLKKNQIYL